MIYLILVTIFCLVFYMTATIDTETLLYIYVSFHYDYKQQFVYEDQLISNMLVYFINEL